MYSSDIDAHNHVNSTEKNHARDLSNILTYNTQIHSLFYSVICFHPHVWSPRSAHYWQHIIWKPTIYQRYHSIHVKKSLRPSTVRVVVSEVCFSPWDLVLSTLFVLTYHPCIRSSLHINFTSLASISPISNENYGSITYVPLKHVPGSEKNISWAPHRVNGLAASQQQTTDIVLSGNAK